ncbi:MAG: DUF2262 domain-containing protein [Myxococcaceae bacterium]
MPDSRIHDEVLGSLRHDAELDRYQGSYAFEATFLTISVSSDGGSFEAALARARHILLGLKHYSESAKEYAALKLLGRKNDSWLDEDEDPLTSDEFKARMQLTALDFSGDGGVTFWHDDGDLFWGHAIEIDMNGEDRYFRADTPG